MRWLGYLLGKERQYEVQNEIGNDKGPWKITTSSMDNIVASQTSIKSAILSLKQQSIIFRVMGSWGPSEYHHTDISSGEESSIDVIRKLILHNQYQQTMHSKSAICSKNKP
jgi:hypothetical protein